jgi:hypothetical protein
MRYSFQHFEFYSGVLVENDQSLAQRSEPNCTVY